MVMLTLCASCKQEPVGGKLAGSYWTLSTAKLAGQAVKLSKDSEITLVFSEVKLNGNAPCNGYFAGYSVVMAWQSYVFKDVGQGTIAVPLWIPQSVMALGVVALAIALLDNLVRFVVWGTTSYPRDGSQPSTV